MELANILELIHAVSDSDLTEFNLQDDTLNISMSKEKTIVQQMAVNTDPADAQQYQPVVQQAVHVESVNAAYFSTLFKKETGKNFLEYVTELRIQNAKNYLIQTNYDIAEVASAVGYNDLKYFSKLFKKTTGLNPSEFRKL